MALVPVSQHEPTSPEKVKANQEKLANASLNDLDAEEVGKVVSALQDEIKIIKKQLESLPGYDKGKFFVKRCKFFIRVSYQVSSRVFLQKPLRIGLAVILISADLEELIGLSDRLLVMLRGEIVAELDPTEVTPRDLGSYMTGASVQQGGGS